MATYPGSVPDLAAICLSNPQSFAQFTALVAELQAIVATLGPNPQAAFGTVDARVDALEATAAVAANTGYRNVRVFNNASTPLTKIDVTADVLACEGALLTNVACTVDLTVTGKNGMTHTRAVSTWYHVWVGQKPSTGEVCAILDDQPTRGLIDVSHATLTGFTRWRRVGARRTDAVSTGQLPRCTQVDDVALYDTWWDLSTSTTLAPTTWVTRTANVACPSTSRRAGIGAMWSNTAGSVTDFAVSEVGVDVGRFIGRGDSSAIAQGWVSLDASQAFRYRGTGASAVTFQIWTAGYHDPI